MTNYSENEGLQMSEGQNKGQIAGNARNTTSEDEEEFGMLMSLVLDGLLSEDESSRFDGFLNEQAGFCDRWQEWQLVDALFVESPSMEPPPGFAARVGEQLVAVERRRRLWLGVFVGAVSVLLFGSILVGVTGLGAYVLYYQPTWPGELVHLLAYWTAATASQLASLFSAVSAVWATPQAKYAGLGYLVVTVAVLLVWMRFLRRSVQSRELMSA